MLQRQKSFVVQLVCKRQEMSASDAKSRLNVLCLQIHKMPPVFETQRVGDAFIASVTVPFECETIRDHCGYRKFSRKSDAEQFIAFVALIRMHSTDEHIVFKALFALHKLQTQNVQTGFSQAAIRAQCADSELSKTAVNRVLNAMLGAGLVEQAQDGATKKPMWRFVHVQKLEEQQEMMQDVAQQEDVVLQGAGGDIHAGEAAEKSIVLLDGDHGAPEGATWRSRGVKTIAFVGHAFTGNVQADEIVRASMPVREASDMMAAFWAGKHLEMLRTNHMRVYIASNDAGWMQLAHALRSHGIDTVYCRANGDGEHVW